MSSTLLWYTTRATGLVALLLLTFSMVLGVLTANRFSTPSWPGFAQQDLHKRIALVSLGFVAIHVLTSVLDTYVKIGLVASVVPFTSQYDRFWVSVGTIGVDAMIAVTLTSLVRHRLPPRFWRAVHWLTYLCWPVALAHAFGMGTDMKDSWAVGFGVGCTAVLLAAVGSRAVVYNRTLRAAPVVAGHQPSARRPVKHRAT